MASKTFPRGRGFGSIKRGSQPAPKGGGGGAGGPVDPNALTVTSAQGLACLPLLGCLFTITGNNADALVGTISYGGAITSLVNTP